MSTSATDSDIAYEKLKEIIFTGGISPGYIYTEKELVSLVGMGRTPVREGIFRLSQEGLLSVSPRRGVVLIVPTTAELQDIFEMRLLLEPQFVRMAFDRISDKAIDEWLNRLHELLASDDTPPEEKIRIDHEIHEFIAQSSGNSMGIPLLKMLLDRSQISWILSTRIPARYPSTWYEQIKFFEALKQRDLEKAVKAMDDHIRTSLDDLTRLVIDRSRSFDHR